MTGVVSNNAPWRHLFVLRPVFQRGCTVIADSRGPILGALVVSAVGVSKLTVWLWRERLFRIAVLIGAGISAFTIVYLVGSDNDRVADIVQSGLDTLRFNCGSDDIRAALYASATEILRHPHLWALVWGRSC